MMVKIYFQTYGCSVNFSESEVMAGLLVEAGFEIVEDKERADVIVINICTVKGEAKALKGIKKIKKGFPRKKLVIAGCILKQMIPLIREIAPEASLINTDNIKHIIEVVEETINDNPVEALVKEKEIKIGLPRIRRNSIIGIVPISSGCLGSCAYCSVKLVKGELFSYPIEEVVKEVRMVLNGGCKEVWITSQDNGAYMLEKGKPQLVQLLNELVKIAGDFKIRIGMMNPNHLLGFLDELINVYKNDKIFKFLHIPVQSGNDEILKAMGREYKAEDFKMIVNCFRKEIPGLTLATDIMAGFPGETEQQFRDSLNLIKLVTPDVLNISRFRVRAGTAAAKLKQIPGGEVKNRSRLMTSIFNNIAYMQNEKWLGWQGDILIDEKGKDDSWVGRNHAYKPIIIKGDFKLGDMVKVKIRKVTPHDLRGEVL